MSERQYIPGLSQLHQEVINGRKNVIRFSQNNKETNTEAIGENAFDAIVRTGVARCLHQTLNMLHPMQENISVALY